MKPVWDYEVFLSHNSRDKAAVEVLARRLLEAGVRPWLDKWDLVPGEDWLPAIEGAMRASPAIAVCVGPSGFGKVHNTELQAALNATYADESKRVLPVLLPGAAEGGGDVPDFLKLKTWIDYRREDDEAFDRLLKAVRGERPGAVAPDTSECPYRGLEPFKAEHARFFYGREEEVSGLLDSLRSGDRLLFLVGGSGSGKSSLVLAGVVPAVQSGQLDDSYAWRVVSMKPGANPCRSLASALLEVARNGAAGATEPVDDLVERVRGVDDSGEERSGLLGLRASSALFDVVHQFETRSREVRDFDQGRTLLVRLERAVRRMMAEIDVEAGAEAGLARDLSQIEQLSDLFLHRVEAFADGLNASLPEDTNLLLIIDQFEELFTLSDDQALRSSFLEGILHAVRAPDSRIHVIVTARADFLGKFLDDPLIAPIVQSSMRVALSVMDRGQIERSIRGPAGQVGLQVEDAVVDALVEGVAGEPGDLPLLQFTLYELWRQREGGKITWEAYNAMGGLKGAIAQRAEEVFEKLGASEVNDDGASPAVDQTRDQLVLRRILGRLVQLGEGTEDTRRPATREELRAVDVDRADSLIERLVETRLLTASANEIEVAHEAVIREWGRLRQWIDEDRSALRLRQEIDRAEDLWSAGGGEESDLWRGGRLERALELEESGDLNLAPRELAFLEASSAAVEAERSAERERRAKELQTARELAVTRGRASRRLMFGAIFATMLAVLAGYFYWQSLINLREARSRQIAFESETIEQADGMQSLLLAIEAVEEAETPEAIKELYDSLIESHERLRLLHDQTVLYAAWNAKGDRILTYGIDERARLWDFADATENDGGHISARWLGTSGPVSRANWDSQGERISLTALGTDPITFLDADGKPVDSIEIVEEAEGAPTESLAAIENTESAETKHADSSSPDELVPDDPRWPPGLKELIESSIEDAQGPELTIQYIRGHLDRVTHVSFFPSEAPELILTLSYDNTGRVWTVDGVRRAVLRGHSGSVLYGAWHPDKTHVITASKDTTVRIWEVDVLLDATPRKPESPDPGSPQRSLPTDRPSTPTFTSWSPDGKLLLQADDEGKTWLYPDPDSSEPSPYLILSGHQEDILDAAWYPANDPKKILTTSFDHTARVWTLPDVAELSSPRGKDLLELGGETALELIGHLTSVQKGRWSPDGSLILTVGSGGTASLWDAQGRNITFLGAQSDKVKDAYWGTDEDEKGVFHVVYGDGRSRTFPGTVPALLEVASQRRSWDVQEGGEMTERRASPAYE